ncbi:MAG: TlyA family rRNA (cytidine-2'-O)-methyltransferase [Proteobacteria bacterium]|nr:TlyA family rRNA (cytidine-2'-O)-methyltransferase [Pseudomonadota bacterium]NIS68124.1 TlyA family rRNA (cytidine-2'-O)-methyltransferase [Pseudomonadota bacterium]
MSARERLDRVLVTRGLVPSRERAKALIMAGKVLVDENRVEKPGTQVRADARVRLAEGDFPYVSRGGVKLEGALKSFGIDPRHKKAIDVGASTGGFTDCLIQNGASKVFAVDVGYGQLAWKLQKDPRVVNLERRNIRYLEFQEIGEPVDIIVVDTSFISVRKFLGRLCEMIKDDGDIVILVKPQFEIGKGEVEKGGVVRDPVKHLRVVEKIQQWGIEIGLSVEGVMESPLKGTKGNTEFFVHFVKAQEHSRPSRCS